MATTFGVRTGVHEAPPPEYDFSLVAESRVDRFLARYGLSMSGVPSAFRMAALLSAIAFLPPFVWAIFHGTAFTRGEGSFRACFGLHVRALVTIPCFVLAGATVERVVHIVLARLLTYGLLPEENLSVVAETIRRARALRDSSRLLLSVFAVAAVAYVLSTTEEVSDLSLAWGRIDDGTTSRLGFGPYYYLFVVRPFVALLLMSWVFRIGLLAFFLYRVGRLDLRIVPTHPDQAGGLGFLTYLPVALTPVVFGISSLVAAFLARDMLYHHMTLTSLAHSTVIVVVGTVFLVMLPLMMLVPHLAFARRRGLAEYGAFVARRSRLVEQRWVRGPVREEDRGVEPALQALELGPESEVAEIYAAVERMRPLPVTKYAAGFVVVVAALPMLPLALMRVPLDELMKPLLALF